MRLLTRTLLILTTFLTVGILADRLITTHALHQGKPEYAIRLAAAMTGLFAGGLAATVLTLALLLRRSKATLAPEAGPNRTPPTAKAP